MRSLLTSRLVCILAVLLVLAAAKEVPNGDSSLHGLLKAGAADVHAKTLEGAPCGRQTSSPGSPLPRCLRIALPPFSTALEADIDQPYLEFPITDAPGSVHVTAHAMTGRRVRTLARNLDPSQCNLLEWNRCDEYGTPVETGLYLIRVTTSDGHRATKAILVS